MTQCWPPFPLPGPEHDCLGSGNCSSLSLLQTTLGPPSPSPLAQLATARRSSICSRLGSNPPARHHIDCPSLLPLPFPHSPVPLPSSVFSFYFPLPLLLPISGLAADVSGAQPMSAGGACPRPLSLWLSVILLLVFLLPLPVHQFPAAKEKKEANALHFAARGTRQSKHHRSRWPRAPAVWGEPAPDYSLARLEDPSAHLHLYALLFVDLKTSDHYRREHQLVKREVMRLASEANNYFYQINMRLLVVDVLETFRDDLSLYSFELYRNQRLSQLPFHNFAALVTYRYAGGLAFVGGMCTAKSVMMAGFYPHNPEAMGSIFFHEVAHLVGVPHRPANESLDVPNCPCAAANYPTGGRQSPPPAEKSSANASVIVDGRTTGAGCLKIPGFDQDCSLQMMVNLAQRTRCLPREPREDIQPLPLCGNGVREGNEQCDCGPLERTCAQWNCDAQTCARLWPLWTIWLTALCLFLALSCPPVALLWLKGRLLLPSSPSIAVASHRKCRLFFAGFPLLLTASKEDHQKKAKVAFREPKRHRHRSKRRRQTKKVPSLCAPSRQSSWRKSVVGTLAKPWHSLCRIWRTLTRSRWPQKGRGPRRRADKTRGLVVQPSILQRPNRPPPPPPAVFIRSNSSGSKSFGRPIRPPPPLPAQPYKCVRPNRAPPVPPPAPKGGKAEEEQWTTDGSSSAEADEWDD